MHEDKRNIRISGAQMREIIRQNRMMRELLEAWPARQVMMGYEKDWDLKRRSFLEEHRPVLPTGDEEGPSEEIP